MQVPYGTRGGILVQPGQGRRAGVEIPDPVTGCAQTDMKLGLAIARRLIDRAQQGNRRTCRNELEKNLRQIFRIRTVTEADLPLQLDQLIDRTA